ncbi:oxidoreductase, NAD-binding domain protein [Bordetella bronchiseptica E014]|uniref:Gfo/Idh/MocA family protein n=1 Tax=Bordetella bronchiseptica TaxID=518 RepID=UPI00028A4CC9|nr:Gfo/Idh/MocA family oxidoreductase [Bordetella bronchiseptica]KCV29403.1 oxidoreductase, NAD-binding domain protein [Bordetella bronchiseptica 00-P-2730]AUL17601.1 dehydrogenase [Bordetella bronchiseptica]AWP60840.1 dehydrogenase [Bordetella bronchiseptica]KAK69791.1 oxidoreductase, NAD-binding domain protein [Bordetella bronchiseptica MO211]KAK74049.1 oxidoreductase, NAD-binding domain protein [Bordetella bronchiseptica CA90 BB02]
MKIRFGICGLGFAGSVLMAPAMRHHPDAQIVAACDPNEDVRERFGKEYGIPVFATLAEMMRHVQMDAVYIASPHQFHCEHVVQASEQGLHIIVEKPLTLSRDEADRMIEAVERAGVHLVVGTSRSHDPVVRTLRAIVQEGSVGRVSMLNCFNYTDFLYRPRRPEELDTSKGGGIIYNQLPHQIDSIKTITGQRITAVRAMTGRLDPKRPTEGNCAAMLTLEDGACAVMVYSGYDHFDSDEMHFWLAEGGRAKQPNHGGARKVLRQLEGDEAELRRSRYGFGGPISKSMESGNTDRKQPHFGVMLVTCEHADLRASPEGVLVYGDEGVREVPAITGRGPFSQGDTIDELRDAIAGVAPALRDARWGKDTLEVCLAVLESSATGRQVER